ncbi:hypothetical protein BOG92_000920 [Streptomyces sp. WAC00263]|nr:hypothetical protein BOG92_000920 [Streptomyces sp. WAC00263]
MAVASGTPGRADHTAGARRPDAEFVEHRHDRRIADPLPGLDTAHEVRQELETGPPEQSGQRAVPSRSLPRPERQ